MKSRASLVLMEQLIMVLVFALAASACLRLFVKAEQISAETVRRDQAVVLAQDAAEMLKYWGDPEEALRRVDSGAFTLDIRQEDTAIPDFAQGEITVSYHGELVFSLNVGWQEAGA